VDKEPLLPRKEPFFKIPKFEKKKQNCKFYSQKPHEALNLLFSEEGYRAPFYMQFYTLFTQFAERTSTDCKYNGINGERRKYYHKKMVQLLRLDLSNSSSERNLYYLEKNHFPKRCALKKPKFQVLFPKATRGFEPIIYRGVLQSALQFDILYVFTQFPECTSTHCKYNGILMCQTAHGPSSTRDPPS
jgi:hypothetical protein